MKPRRVLVTAGNTREKIDPVRFLSNISTGVMGFEIAKAAHAAGYETILIMGPTDLEPPKGVKMVRIVTAAELEKAAVREFKHSDALFMTSAVCDFRPAKMSKLKLKRKGKFDLKLESTPDILKKLSFSSKRNQTVIGFCLETDHLIRNAKRKLREKKLDYIVANYLGPRKCPFGRVNTTVEVLSKDGTQVAHTNISKATLAKRLIKLISEEYLAE